MINLTKISFGGPSAVVTSLGLIVGFAAARTPRATVLTALLIAALADNLTDALSIHIYQESEKLERRRAFAATVGNFATRLGICGTFVFLLAVLQTGYAVTVAVTWGVILLSGLTWLIARNRGANPVTEVGKHVAVALIVIAVSLSIGAFFHGITFRAPLELPWHTLPNGYWRED